MRRPEVWMKRNRSVFGVETLRRRVEKVERFRCDARDDFRGYSAPWKCFANTEHPASPRHRRDNGVGVERLDAAQINDFKLSAFASHFFSDGERFMHHGAVSHD